MGQYALRRVLLFFPTLLLATVLGFALFWIVPRDPALTIPGGGGNGEGARCGPNSSRSCGRGRALTGPFTCSTRVGWGMHAGAYTRQGERGWILLRSWIR